MFLLVIKMTYEQFINIKELGEAYGINVERTQYLGGYKYFVNGKKQKSIWEMRETIKKLMDKWRSDHVHSL